MILHFWIEGIFRFLCVIVSKYKQASASDISEAETSADSNN